MSSLGILYLIPCTLGDTEPAEVLPATVLTTIRSVDSFIVENSKSARAFLKSCAISTPQNQLLITEIDKHDPYQDFKKLIAPLLAGRNTGLLSEAGVPAVADPGAAVVKLAHQYSIKVVPLIGPSSILLALMGSGMEGQRFCFHGYLPIERGERIKTLQRLEKEAVQFSQTQIFIETPYRNNALLKDMLEHLSSGLRLCIAANLTLSDEMIRTLTIRDWKKQSLDLNKRPVVYCIGE